MQLLDNVVLDINPNKHAAIIKTITLNTFKTVYFNSDACRSSFMSDWAARTLAHLSSTICRYYEKNVITRKYVVLTRNICRFNEKRCRYYEKRCRYYEKICHFNEKRCRYYEKICRFNEKRSRYNEKRSRYYEKRSRYNEKRSRYYEKRSRYNDIIEWKKYYVDGSITSP